jgi:hypothetical protein
VQFLKCLSFFLRTLHTKEMTSTSVVIQKSKRMSDVSNSDRQDRKGTTRTEILRMECGVGQNDNEKFRDINGKSET